MKQFASLILTGCLIVSLNSIASEIKEPSYLNYRFDNTTDNTPISIEYINRLVPSANGKSALIEPGYLNYNYQTNTHVPKVETFNETLLRPTYN